MTKFSRSTKVLVTKIPFGLAVLNNCRTCPTIFEQKHLDFSAACVIFPSRLLFNGSSCTEKTGETYYSACVIVQRSEGLTATQRVYAPWRSSNTEEEVILHMIDALKAENANGD